MAETKMGLTGVLIPISGVISPYLELMTLGPPCSEDIPSLPIKKAPKNLDGGNSEQFHHHRN